MAALITLQRAKDHLGVTDDDHNADVQFKLEQATDIVLDYLKGRSLTVSTLTSSAGVATVTTRHLHGLTTNDTVYVRGAIEPEYNGAVVVTVTSTSEFTYAISGTPGTPATGAIEIRVPPAYTQATVPGRVQAAILLVLGHLYEHGGEDMTSDEQLWKAIERLLARSRMPAIA